MGKNKKQKSKKNNSQIIQKKSNDMIAGVQRQTVPVKGMLDKNEIHSCSCYRNGYCTLRDDLCKPYSIKCIKNKQSFMPATFSGTSAVKRESTRKVFRGSNTYNPYAEERYGSNSEIEHIDFTDKVPNLFVFKGFLNLSKKATIDYFAKIEEIGTGRKHEILVAYNMKSDRYYISETYLKYLHKKKIYLNAIINACNDGSVPLITPDFNDISRLAMYGYSAGKNGLREAERRKIIRHVIDNKIMRRYELIEHLQGLINLRKKREDADFSVAISNWESDIVFISKY